MERKQRMGHRKEITENQSVAEDIISSLTDMRDALRDKERLQARFTMRRVELELEPRAFSSDDVRDLRGRFQASQVVFAHLLGVKVGTLRRWEQGTQQPPPMSCRLMELMDDDPDHFIERLERSVRTRMTTA